jgi:hypothetical protein
MEEITKLLLAKRKILTGDICALWIRVCRIAARSRMVA